MATTFPATSTPDLAKKKNTRLYRNNKSTILYLQLKRRRMRSVGSPHAYVRDDRMNITVWVKPAQPSLSLEIRLHSVTASLRGRMRRPGGAPTACLPILSVSLSANQ